MEHQDWNKVVFSNKKPEKPQVKNVVKKDPNVVEKLVAPSNLGVLISQARTTTKKTRKQLANELGISEQVLSRWETNKETPENKDIAKVEKLLRIKLPRVQKVKVFKMSFTRLNTHPEYPQRIKSDDDNYEEKCPFFDKKRMPRPDYEDPEDIKEEELKDNRFIWTWYNDTPELVSLRDAEIDFKNGKPITPIRTGIKGRGILPKFGPQIS
jgi:transcriptional regulator with XRE-family HTH domain